MKNYFARSHIIQNMCCTTYFSQFQPLPTVIPYATRPQQSTPRSSVSSGRLQFYYTHVDLRVILKLKDTYVLSIVNYVFM